MLDRLESKGVRMCVCSATWQFMCEAGAGPAGGLDKFQFVLTAGDGNSKHRPAVFYQALSRMGGRDPAQCVVCEDALYAARTAHDAGFTVIGVADAASAPDEKGHPGRQQPVPDQLVPAGLGPGLNPALTRRRSPPLPEGQGLPDGGLPPVGQGQPRPVWRSGPRRGSGTGPPPG